MVNEGMSFRLTLHPFTVVGTVGGEVTLHMAVPSGMEITGRKDVYELSLKLERLCDEVSRLHSWEGNWNIESIEVPFSEDPEDGVHVQDLA